jgi:hypothetical protein
LILNLGEKLILILSNKFLEISHLLYLKATWTHCEVANWLPSLSAAVASYTPEKYIWRFLIGIHGTPRLAIALAFK